MYLFLTFSDALRINRTKGHQNSLMFVMWIKEEVYQIWAAPCENMSSGICGQQRSRSLNSLKFTSSDTQIF